MNRGCVFVSVLMVVGIAMLVVGCATSYWRGSGEYHEGLWYVCLDGVCSKSTLEQANWGVQMYVVRGFLFAGMTLVVIGTMSKLAGKCFDDHFQRRFTLTLYLFTGIALGNFVIAMSVYTKWMNSRSYEWKSSFYLSWFGTSIYGLGVMLMGCYVECFSD